MPVFRKHSVDAIHKTLGDCFVNLQKSGPVYFRDYGAYHLAINREKHLLWKILHNLNHPVNHPTLLHNSLQHTLEYTLATVLQTPDDTLRRHEIEYILERIEHYIQDGQNALQEILLSYVNEGRSSLAIQRIEYSLSALTQWLLHVLLIRLDIQIARENDNPSDQLDSILVHIHNMSTYAITSEESGQNIPYAVLVDTIDWLVQVYSIDVGLLFIEKALFPKIDRYTLLNHCILMVAQLRKPFDTLWIIDGEVAKTLIDDGWDDEEYCKPLFCTSVIVKDPQRTYNRMQDFMDIDDEGDATDAVIQYLFQHECEDRMESISFLPEIVQHVKDSCDDIEHFKYLGALLIKDRHLVDLSILLEQVCIFNVQEVVETHIFWIHSALKYNIPLDSIALLLPWSQEYLTLFREESVYSYILFTRLYKDESVWANVSASNHTGLFPYQRYLTGSIKVDFEHLFIWIDSISIFQDAPYDVEQINRLSEVLCTLNPTPTEQQRYQYIFQAPLEHRIWCIDRLIQYWLDVDNQQQAKNLIAFAIDHIWTSIPPKTTMNVWNPDINPRPIANLLPSFFELLFSFTKKVVQLEQVHSLHHLLLSYIPMSQSRLWKNVLGLIRCLLYLKDYQNVWVILNSVDRRAINKVLSNQSLLPNFQQSFEVVEEVNDVMLYVIHQFYPNPTEVPDNIQQQYLKYFLQIQDTLSKSHFQPKYFPIIYVGLTSENLTHIKIIEQLVSNDRPQKAITDLDAWASFLFMMHDDERARVAMSELLDYLLSQKNTRYVRSIHSLSSIQYLSVTDFVDHTSQFQGNTDTLPIQNVKRRLVHFERRSTLDTILKILLHAQLSRPDHNKRLQSLITAIEQHDYLHQPFIMWFSHQWRWIRKENIVGNTTTLSTALIQTLYNKGSQILRSLMLTAIQNELYRGLPNQLLTIYKQLLLASERTEGKHAITTVEVQILLGESIQYSEMADLLNTFQSQYFAIRPSRFYSLTTTPQKQPAIPNILYTADTSVEDWLRNPDLSQSWLVSTMKNDNWSFELLETLLQQNALVKIVPCLIEILESLRQAFPHWTWRQRTQRNNVNALLTHILRWISSTPVRQWVQQDSIAHDLMHQLVQTYAHFGGYHMARKLAIYWQNHHTLHGIAAQITVFSYQYDWMHKSFSELDFLAGSEELDSILDALMNESTSISSAPLFPSSGTISIDNCIGLFWKTIHKAGYFDNPQSVINSLDWSCDDETLHTVFIAWIQDEITWCKEKVDQLNEFIEDIESTEPNYQIIVTSEQYGWSQIKPLIDASFKRIHTYYNHLFDPYYQLEGLNLILNLLNDPYLSHIQSETHTLAQLTKVIHAIATQQGDAIYPSCKSMLSYLSTGIRKRHTWFLEQEWPFEFIREFATESMATNHPICVLLWRYLIKNKESKELCSLLLPILWQQTTNADIVEKSMLLEPFASHLIQKRRKTFSQYAFSLSD